MTTQRAEEKDAEFVFKCELMTPGEPREEGAVSRQLVDTQTACAGTVLIPSPQLASDRLSGPVQFLPVLCASVVPCSQCCFLSVCFHTSPPLSRCSLSQLLRFSCHAALFRKSLSSVLYLGPVILNGGDFVLQCTFGNA